MARDLPKGYRFKAMTPSPQPAIPLAFSTNAYTRFTLAEALSDIAAAGYAGVEILADTPHAYPDDLTPALAASVRNHLERLNLKVSNINANCTFGYWRHAPPEPFFEPSLISPVPAYRVDRDRMIRKVIDFAAAINAGNICITSGKVLGGVPPAEGARLLRENLPPLLDYAARHNVLLGLECEPGLFVEYADELAELITAINHPALGANLDVGHSHVIGEGVGHAVRRLGQMNRIWNLHVEDLLGRKHYHLIPGDGNFPWAELVAALRDVRYTRFATVELYTMFADPQSAARRSIDYLRPLFAAHT